MTKGCTALFKKYYKIPLSMERELYLWMIDDQFGISGTTLHKLLQELRVRNLEEAYENLLAIRDPDRTTRVYTRNKNNKQIQVSTGQKDVEAQVSTLTATYCLVCLAQYDSDLRALLLIACGHSICELCCQRLTMPTTMQIGRFSLINCPKCRAETCVPEGGLPQNFALHEMVTDLETATKEIEVIESQMNSKQEVAAKRAFKLLLKTSDIRHLASSIKQTFEQRFELEAPDVWHCLVKGPGEELNVLNPPGSRKHFLLMKHDDVKLCIYTDKCRRD